MTKRQLPRRSRGSWIDPRRLHRGEADGVRHFRAFAKVRPDRGRDAVHSAAAGRMTRIQLAILLIVLPLFISACVAFGYGLGLALAIQRRNWNGRAERDDRLRAEEKGAALLRSWLSPEQAERLDSHGLFHVFGSDTGKCYRIKYGRAMNIEELDCRGSVSPSGASSHGAIWPSATSCWRRRSRWRRWSSKRSPRPTAIGYSCKRVEALCRPLLHLPLTRVQYLGRHCSRAHLA
jgi:hypothetical protein